MLHPSQGEDCVAKTRYCSRLYFPTFVELCRPRDKFSLLGICHKR